MKLPHKIWTIGHSTHPIAHFISMLNSFEIELLADVRSLPGSNKNPQFNKESLEKSLMQNSIGYVHVPLLGGRRKTNKNSRNLTWKSLAFRGYADYMETEEFLIGIDNLLYISNSKRTALMCAEALWWRCHRSLISDYFKSINIEVVHIMGIDKSSPHEYTQPARIVNGRLSYNELGENLF